MEEVRKRRSLGRLGGETGHRSMQRGLYHDAIYDFGQPVPSYWEATAPAPDPSLAPLSGEASCDVAIIGGGYTGLSAALHLARDHGIEARVLEAGKIAWGASGRNGGFCCLVRQQDVSGDHDRPIRHVGNQALLCRTA